jgi:hypothetical protein
MPLCSDIGAETSSRLKLKVFRRQGHGYYGIENMVKKLLGATN